MIVAFFWLFSAGAAACLYWGGKSSWRGQENFASVYLFFLCAAFALILGLLIWNHP